MRKLIFKVCCFTVLKTANGYSRKAMLIRSGQSHLSDFDHWFRDGHSIQSEIRDAMNLLLSLLGIKHMLFVHWDCEPGAIRM